LVISEGKLIICTKKIKTIRIKKIKKIVFRTLVGLILLLLVLFIALTTPFVQTKLAQYFVKSINEDFGIHMQVDGVQLTLFGGVKLKKVLIIDHHKDTLIYVKRLNTSILGVKKILDGDLIFYDIALDGVLFNLKTYKKEKKTNLDYLIDAFGKSKTPSKKKFLLTATSIDLSNGRFILTDENHETPPISKCMSLKSMLIFKKCHFWIIEEYILKA
jgi:hypothetical protein